MQSMSTWPLQCLLIGISLHAAQVFSQGTQADAEAAAPVEKSAEQLYRDNRLAFQQERTRLETAAQHLDEQLANKSQALSALGHRKTELLKLSATRLPEPPGRLPVVTQRLEAGVAAVINPLHLYAADRAAGLSERQEATRRIVTAAASRSGYVSFLLPVVVILSLVLFRYAYPAPYHQHRIHLHRAALLLMVVFPLSSMAQMEEPDTAKLRPLASLLGEADEVLGLAEVQKYIRLLSAGENKGRRLRISDVDLGVSPLEYFDSVVVGSGEYHSSLAALYLASGDVSAARRQLRPLADAGTRFATLRVAPQRYESLLSRAAVYLFESGDNRLARDIVALHLDNFRSGEHFDAVYPLLLENGFTATAERLATQYTTQAQEAQELVAFARVLQVNGSELAATAVLKKALVTASSTETLVSIVDLALAQNALGLITATIDAMPLYVDDVADFFAVAEKLRTAGWASEASRLLASAIERSGTQATSLVEGEVRSTLETLKYLSFQSFRRGFLPVAESAALAAMEPLSAAEQRSLLMALPDKEKDRTRIPEPDRLAAPLYLGLLDEKQGRLQAARARFETESRLALESVAASKGLYVPEILNHLTLLGSVLPAGTPPREWSGLDALLSRLEQQKLEEVRAATAEAVQDRQSRAARLDEQIAALSAEIALLEQQLTVVDVREGPSFFAGALLLARSAALVMVLLLALGAVGTAALRYAAEARAQRTAAFFWKLTESVGWLWVLSIVSAPLGLVMIVAAQYFLLNQSRAADVADLRRSIDPATAGRPRNRNANEADDWENVIRMLRSSKSAEAAS